MKTLIFYLLNLKHFALLDNYSLISSTSLWMYYGLLISHIIAIASPIKRQDIVVVHCGLTCLDFPDNC